VAKGKTFASSAVFGVCRSIIAPTANATLSTTVLRRFGNAALNPRPTSSANRRTVPILATSYLSSLNA
jgi:hypothetical protein